MNALKAVQKTDDQLIVENYIVLFGGRDLEGSVNSNVNADGSAGEFFTKATDLRSPYTNTGVVYVDWEHGLNDIDEPNKDEILGFVDWTTAKADDTGIKVRRILDRRAAFVKMIEPLIDEGMIGTSSEAIPGRVRKAGTGEILRWPLRRDTLTVTPMEPRMLSENALMAAKALAAKYPAIKSVLNIEAPEVEAEADTESASGEPVSIPEMTLEIDTADLADKIADRLRQSQGGQPPSVDIAEEQDEADQPQNKEPAAEPETAQESDDDQLVEVLGAFLDTVNERLQEVINNE